MQFHEEIIEILQEENPQAQMAVGFEEAVIGISRNHWHHQGSIAVYDIGLIVDILVERDGMTIEGAYEFFEFNIQCSYMGENTPLFIQTS